MEADQLRDFIFFKVTPNGIAYLIAEFLETVGFGYDGRSDGRRRISALQRLLDDEHDL
jgi:hypothetical protein